MTIEERFERIEHYTAALAEERRKDRDEYKALWRETQRQIDENARAIAGLTRDLINLTGTVSELRISIRDLAQESRNADARLGARIDDLASAIGQLISKPK